MIHWVQDFDRVSEEPTIDFLDQDSFREALKEAGQRSDIRKQEVERSDTLSREAAAGKLTGEKKWDDWYTAFFNMLSTIPGVQGIPLIYVVRENQEPLATGHTTFLDLVKEGG